MDDPLKGHFNAEQKKSQRNIQHPSYLLSK